MTPFRCLLFALIAWIIVAPSSVSGQEISELRPGTQITGGIADSSPIINTEILVRDYADAPVRGQSFRIRVETEGSYTIDLRSHLFDAYLVLRDEDGAILLEDDDGGLLRHSRLVVASLVPDRAYTVDVCALHGRVGPFELRLENGRPASLSDDERKQAIIDDARSMLRQVQAFLGADHRDTAHAFIRLATLLEDDGKPKEAIAALQQSVSILERIEGSSMSELLGIVEQLTTLLEQQAKTTDACALLEDWLKHTSKIEEGEKLENHWRTRLTKMYLAEGLLEPAVPHYEYLIRSLMSTKAPDDPELLKSLDLLLWLYQTAGRYEAALPVARQALALAEKTLGDDHEETVSQRHGLALLLWKLGRPEEALPVAEGVLSSLIALGKTNEDATATMNLLAAIHRSLGNPEESRRQLNRCISIRAATPGGAESLRMATYLCNLAAVLAELGHHEESLASARRASSIHSIPQHPESLAAATHATATASALKNLGRYAEARSLYEQALTVQEKTLGARHPDTAATLTGLGDLLWDLGLYEESRTSLERALASVEVAFGPDHPRALTDLNLLARTEFALGHVERAVSLWTRGLEVAQKSQNPSMIGRYVGNLGFAFDAQGDFAKARSLFERNLTSEEGRLGPNHPHLAADLSNLARTLHAQGLYEEARPLYARALTIRETSLDNDHPEIVKLRKYIARFEADTGNANAAYKWARDALLSSERSVERQLWSLSESERIRFARSFRDTLELFLWLRPPELDEQGTAEDEAYRALLRWKGRVSRSLSVDRARRLQELPDEALVLLRELRKAQTRLADELYKTNVGDRKEYEARLDSLRKERNDLEIALTRQYGDPSRVDSLGSSPVDLPTVLARTQPRVVAVDFFVHRAYEPAKPIPDDRTEGTSRKGKSERKSKGKGKGHWTAPVLTAWVTRDSSKPRRIDLGAAATVEQAVRRFLEELTTNRGVVRVENTLKADGRVAISPAAERLREVLWDPLGIASDEAPIVLVSPDSFLGTLPFECLQETDGSYLIEHHGFVYLQDLASLESVLNAKAPSGTGLFVAGGIDYRARGALATPERDESEVRGGYRTLWLPLPGTAEEAAGVQALHQAAFGDTGKRLLLTRQDATEERIKTNLAEFRFVHLATHGYFQPEGLPSMWTRPANDLEDQRMAMRDTEERVTGLLPGLLSGLVCAGANAKPEFGRENGLLTAEEVSMSDLSACDLVVLSACETGLGRAESGEGLIGLRRAFRQANARTVISSLWAVRDETTRELMARFYENLWMKKMGKLEALRSAQLAVLTANRAAYGHGLPSSWGAFVLDGAWR